MDDLLFFIVFVVVLAVIIAVLPFFLGGLGVAAAVVLFAAFIIGVYKSMSGYYSALVTVYGKKVGVAVGVALTAFLVVCLLLFGGKILAPVGPILGLLRGNF